MEEYDCPKCGEDALTEIITFNDNDEVVKCSTCNHIFTVPFKE